MNNVNNDIQGLISAAASATPDRAHDLGQIRERAKALRQRRTITAAALAVLIVVVPVWLTLQDRPSSSPVLPLASSPQSPPSSSATTWPGTSAQRLVGLITLDDYPGGTSPARPAIPYPGYGEVHPDGRIQSIPRPQGLALGHDGGVGPAPHGGLAMLATENPPRDAQPCPPDTKRYLILLDRDGRETLRRDLYQGCDRHLRFIGVDDTHAYLLRDRTVVAHDLATGAERELFGTARIVWLDFQGSVIVAIEPNGISTTDTQQCGQMGATIRTYHVATGATASQDESTINVCDHIESATASPDGTRVAFIDDARGEGVVYLKVFDMGTGAILATRRVSDETLPVVTGAVWSDQYTVWVVSHPRDGGDPLSLLVSVP